MEPYLGSIIIFGGNFVIRGWASCNGQILSIAQNTALFSILGTYGGNGQSTFALPDLQGRVPAGVGSGLDLGMVSGTQTVTLTTAQIPAHTHAAQSTGTSAAPASGNPAGTLLATQGRSGGLSLFATGNADTPMATTAATVGPTGGSQPFSIMQPYLVVNYLIALEGLFPSRN